MNIDFDHFFRTKIESMLVTASWSGRVKDMLGITGVSQVWGDKPEWYFWVQNAPGVYGLVLEEGETFASAPKKLYSGLFTLKCYPFPDNSVFSAFSRQEQQMIKSLLFDDTQTPRLEFRDRIPASFFKVGAVSLILDPDDTMAIFTLDTLSLLKITSEKSESQNPSDSGRGQTLREVPGWSIGLPFFERLIGLYAFHRKQSPRFIGKTRSSGFECFLDGSEELETRPSQEVCHMTLSLIFHKEACSSSHAKSIWHAFMEPDEEVVLEKDLLPEPPWNLYEDETRKIPLNPLWWELADADLKPESSSICGCADHH